MKKELLVDRNLFPNNMYMYSIGGQNRASELLWH
jgi:hypothetical protein